MRKYRLVLSALYITTASFSSYASYEIDEQKGLAHYQTKRQIEKDYLLVLGTNNKDVALQSCESSNGLSFKISTESQDYMPLQSHNISSFFNGIDSLEQLNGFLSAGNKIILKKENDEYAMKEMLCLRGGGFLKKLKREIKRIGRQVDKNVIQPVIKPVKKPVKKVLSHTSGGVGIQVSVPLRTARR